MSTYDKVVVIDGKGHLLGRLASIVSKQILSGQKVVVVRCEEINVSGSHFRNKIKFSHYLNKRCLVNPKRGPFHFRAPSRMLYRVIRGMVPHKTARGAQSLDRLKLFEGIPTPYDKMKRMVVPAALRVLRLKPGRKFTVLKRIASENGWKYEGVVAKLEEKRTVKAQAYHEQNKAIASLKAKAIAQKNEKVEDLSSQLKAFGY